MAGLGPFMLLEGKKRPVKGGMSCFVAFVVACECLEFGLSFCCADALFNLIRPQCIVMVLLIRGVHCSNLINFLPAP